MPLGPDNVLGVGEIRQQGMPTRRSYSWVVVSRSRGRSTPCPRIWVVFSLFFLLQFELASERSQFAIENKTGSERTFRSSYLRKLRFDSLPAGRHLSPPDYKERFTMMGGELDKQPFFLI
ncbi:hypothetical protein M9H77_07116 [Catharanthus roseus]|uniref:Uncharacterized protein n=1 Tax=Catharanthus roseus TaxID=4058 RepID=A0ACC0BU97_CATRO|nr:hypothetical protein M9H77_07116 [Catharanthus roseus]